MTEFEDASPKLSCLNRGGKERAGTICIFVAIVTIATLASVASVETMLLKDPTYMRPASSEQQHDELFYLCSTSVTISYENSVTVD